MDPLKPTDPFRQSDPTQTRDPFGVPSAQSGATIYRTDPAKAHELAHQIALNTPQAEPEPKPAAEAEQIEQQAEERRDVRTLNVEPVTASSSAGKAQEAAQEPESGMSAVEQRRAAALERFTKQVARERESAGQEL